MPRNNKLNVYILTLGCDKNRVDGEVMGGLIYEAGYNITQNPDKADIIIVNTCGFISDATQESIDAVLSLAEHKTKGRCKKLVVAGCMAERYGGEILKEIPEADAYLGSGEYYRIVEVIRGWIASSQAPRNDGGGQDHIGDLYKKRLLLPVSHVMPVKIAEGCSNMCTYCTIPSIRGPYHSRPMEDIVDECKGLVNKGARELVFVAQDTASYGLDLYGGPKLHELLKAASTIDNLTWIRIMYAYPEHITADIITAIADNEKICNYIDIPIQHSHSNILKRMGRKSATESLKELIATLRQTIPGITIRTTLMTGFPGETEDEFIHMHDFLQEMRFDRLGVFAYSQEEGTPAAMMDGQIDDKTKNARRERLMLCQQGIHENLQKALIGTIQEVMVDEIKKSQTGYEFYGRSYRDAIETDTIIAFNSTRNYTTGDMASVKITGCDDYDLFGEGL